MKVLRHFRLHVGYHLAFAKKPAAPQMAAPFLHDAVRRQSYRILDAFGLTPKQDFVDAPTDDGLPRGLLRAETGRTA